MFHHREQTASAKALRLDCQECLRNSKETSLEKASGRWGQGGSSGLDYVQIVFKAVRVDAVTKVVPSEGRQENRGLSSLSWQHLEVQESRRNQPRGNQRGRRETRWVWCPGVQVKKVSQVRESDQLWLTLLKCQIRWGLRIEGQQHGSNQWTLRESFHKNSHRQQFSGYYQKATPGSEWRHEWQRTEDVCRAWGRRGHFLPGKDAEEAALGVEGIALLRSVRFAHILEIVFSR